MAADAISRVQSEAASMPGWRTKDFKPVDKANFHFTLIFLGEVADTDVARISSSLSKVKFEPFEVSYQGVGAFPRLGSARVIWVGADEQGSRKLAGLASSVVSALSELGFAPDKPFSPHLTIFRAKPRYPVDASQLAGKFTATIATDRVDRMHLKKSELTPRGPVYSNVYTVEAVK